MKQIGSQRRTESLPPPVRRNGWTVLRTTAGLVVLCSNLGCSGRASYSAPANFPVYRIDTAASEVDAQSAVDATRARDILASEMQGWVAANPSATPARFRAKVRQSAAYWPAAACLGVYVAFGCPSTIHTVEVTLELEVSGHIYQGTGKASRVGGLYYETEGVEALKSAAREAMNHAMGKAG